MKENSAIEDIYNWIKGKVKKQWIVTFVASMCIGLLTYGYFLTNRFLTYDSMWNIYSRQDMISSGRQFLTYVCRISSDYDLPFLNGLLAIFYLALTAIVLVEIFRVKSNIGAVLLSGLLVTFPSVISTFCYTFTVDGYMLALLMVAVAFWLTDNRRFGCVAGAVLLGISLGVYQAYLAFLMVLCVLMLLLYLLEEGDLKKLLGKVGRYAVMGIGGYAFYVVSLNIMLSVKGVELSGYQGTDKINSFSLAQLPAGIQSAFWNFVNFARWENVLTTTDVMKLVFLLSLLVGAGMYAYLFWKKGCLKKPLTIILAVLLVAVLPFCATVINIMSPDTTHHLLMRGAWSLFFIFVVVVMERMAGYVTKREQKVKQVVSAVAMLCSVVLIFEFAKMAHIVSFNMQERYEKNYALTLRIVERLEQTEGYQHGMKVAILGGEPSEEIFPSTDITAGDLSGYFGAGGDYSLNSTEKFAAFMAHYMNVTIQTIEYQEEVKLTETVEFQEMEKFPNSECIRLIGDVWVVKLNG